MQQVVKHPQFKANPIGAVTNHLSATLPPPRQGRFGRPPAKRQGPRQIRLAKRAAKQAAAEAEAAEKGGYSMF